MQLHDLLGGPGGVDVLERVGDTDVDIVSVAHDSRRTGPSALFCCITGANFDGHAFAPVAVRAGAVALLVERVLDLPVPQVRVESVRRAIGPIASRAAGDPSRRLRVVGITGTNGKTTTVHLVGAMVRAAGGRFAEIGTLSGERTTPEAPELQESLTAMLADGVDTVAMEVSSHALAQHRVDGTRFAAVAFTNLGHDHLDYHDDLDAYFEAKARLFTPEFTGHAVVNVDDPRGPELAARASRSGVAVRTFGLDAPADVRMEAVESDSSGSRATLVASEGRAAVRLPLLGRFNVENAAAAAAAALSAGLGFEAVVAGIEAVHPVPGRMDRIDVGQPFTVLVDYAHTPDALDHVLSVARDLVGRDRRVIVVFGCGGDRDRGKRPAMGRVAAAAADVVVVTSDNPRSEDPVTIADAIVAGVTDADVETVVELDRRAAIRQAIGVASPGDVVIVAGKGHEQGQTAARSTVPFDDRLVVRHELESLAWT